MLRTIDAPAGDPVSLADAKAQLRITDTSQDDLITALIAAATIEAQNVVQRRFMTQTLEYVLQRWQPRIRIPVAPVTKDGINSIKYVDWTTQQQQTLDPSLYVVQSDGDSVSIIPAFATIWPIVYSFSPEPIVIQFAAGGADATAVPANVKQAILLGVRNLYSLGERSPFLRRDDVAGVGGQQWEMMPGTDKLLPDAALRLLMAEVW